MPMGRIVTLRNTLLIGIFALLGTFFMLWFLGAGLEVPWTGLQVYEILAAPNIPNLTSPANLSQFIWGSNITFIWNSTDADNNATTSLLQVSNHTAFQPENMTLNLTLNEGNLSLTGFNLSIGRYYWRVRSNDSEGSSGFSSFRQFEVVYAIINISSPANNSVITGGSSVVIRVNEVENGENITSVDVYIQHNGTNLTYSALNTSNTSVTNYTFTYSVPDINSTTLELFAVGYNASMTFNVSSFAELRLTQPASEVGSPNLSFACAFPSNALPNTSLNLTVEFRAAVLVGSVNLTVTHPNGTLERLVETSNTYRKQNISNFYYFYNYTFNGTAEGAYTLRAEVRDLNYPSSSAAVSSASFTLQNATYINLTQSGGDRLELLDTCNNKVVSTGSNLTAIFPKGLYDLDYWSSSLRVRLSLRNINISQSTNLTACNMSDTSESISVPLTTRAIDQFELTCNSSLGFSMVNITYNYTSILASITSQSALEFYRCSNASNCNWEEIGLTLLNTTSGLVHLNFTNFSAFMLSEEVTPVSGGVQSGGSGASSTGSAGGMKVATLELIKPRSLTALENESIRIPIILRNNGQFDLNGILLKAVIPGNEGAFTLRFGRDYIESLKMNRSFETYLDVLKKGAIPGQYEILITSEIINPRFTDTTKFFLDLKEKDYAKKESLLEQLEFMQELFTGNPECLEFSEVLGELSLLINTSKYDAAESLAEDAINNCKQLITSQEPELNLPYQPQLKAQLPVLFVGAAGFLFLTMGFFYFYMRRRPEE